MKRAKISLLALAMIALVTGCSGLSENEAAADEMVGIMEEFASLLESSKDEASAKAAAAKFSGLTTRAKDLKKRVESLPKLTKAEDDELTKKFEAKTKPLQGRIEKEMGRIAQDPAVATVLMPPVMEFGSVMASLKPA